MSRLMIFTLLFLWGFNFSLFAAVPALPSQGSSNTDSQKASSRHVVSDDKSPLRTPPVSSEVLMIEVKHVKDSYEKFFNQIQLIFAFIAIVVTLVGLVEFRNKKKIDDIHDKYVRKIDMLDDVKFALAKKIGEFDEGKRDVEQLKKALELTKDLLFTDSMLTRANMLMNSINGAISAFKSEENNKKKLSYKGTAIDFLESAHKYCDEAEQHLRSSRLDEHTLKNNETVKRELHRQFVRLYNTRANLRKRSYLLDNDAKQIARAVQDLGFGLEFSSEVSSSDKARLHYNMACYECLLGDTSKAKEQLALAKSLNSRYEYTWKYDGDLNALQ